jgi:hypothetical protein
MIDKTKEFEKNSKPFGDMNTTWKVEKFTIKPEHLKLLENMYVDWDDAEFGAPAINPKRPYGNSDVVQDMIEILGLKELKEGIYEFELDGRKWLLKGEDKFNLYLEGKDEEELVDILCMLHKETQKALQICLTLQAFEIGTFRRHEYKDDWLKDISSGKVEAK